jgi:hypothetical protein
VANNLIYSFFQAARAIGELRRPEPRRRADLLAVPRGVGVGDQPSSCPFHLRMRPSETPLCGPAPLPSNATLSGPCSIDPRSGRCSLRLPSMGVGPGRAAAHGRRSSIRSRTAKLEVASVRISLFPVLIAMVNLPDLVMVWWRDKQGVSAFYGGLAATCCPTRAESSVYSDSDISESNTIMIRIYRLVSYSCWSIFISPLGLTRPRMVTIGPAGLSRQ